MESPLEIIGTVFLAVMFVFLVALLGGLVVCAARAVYQEARAARLKMDRETRDAEASARIVPFGPDTAAAGSTGPTSDGEYDPLADYDPDTADETDRSILWPDRPTAWGPDL